MSFRSSFAWGLLGGIIGGMLVTAFVALLWAWLFGPVAQGAYEDAGFRDTQFRVVGPK